MNPLWQNGHWLSPQDYHIAPTDRGLLHGFGLFETFLALDGEPLFLHQHRERLQKSCLTLGWPFPKDDFLEIARELLVRNHLTDGPARCRIALSAGTGSLNDLSLGQDCFVSVSAQALGQSPESITACLAPWQRNEHSPLSRLKCSSYAENVFALDYARRLGFDQAIFLNTSGKVSEAATANLFLVKNGVLHTPALHAGCLPGITRQIVIDLAREHSILCLEDDLTVLDLDSADEIFLTSSVQGILPVIQLQDRHLGNGPLSHHIKALYQEKICKELTISRTQLSS